MAEKPDVVVENRPEKDEGADVEVNAEPDTEVNVTNKPNDNGED